MADVLDDAARLREIDPERMSERVEQLAAQCEEAWEIGEQAAIGDAARPQNVVVLGMGGSAIGGELLQAYTERLRAVPMTVNRDYDLPAFVGPETLVIASSYSGNTEETLSAYDEAVRRGARIVGISTGGELTARCEKNGHPVIRIPGGLSPRAALGYSFVPLLVLFQRFGLIENQKGSFREAMGVLRGQAEQFAPGVPLADNAPKQHARDLVDKLPVIYGRSGWSGVVAYRWKGQMNENAKHPAWSNAFPELDHNEIMGWEAPPELSRSVHLFLLRDRYESDAMARRIDATSRIIESSVGKVTEVRAQGESVLAQMFSLIHVGDFVSLYLALAKGVDPTPVASIDRLKQELAKGR